MCDVKWLLDRIVQLLREPEPDLVPAAARPENALARDGDEDGDGGIDDEAGARGTQPLGNDESETPGGPPRGGSCFGCTGTGRGDIRRSRASTR